MVYFFTTVQIAQVAQPMIFKWARQLGHFELQHRNTTSETFWYKVLRSYDVNIVYSFLKKK